jgi:dipeptidyl aminopeptidase/acylaminoacyl peptidase
VYNRGGNREFGSIRTADLMEFAGLALDGFVVLASQYRGNDGGEGAEEFGGADVADVLHLIALGRSLPEVDPDRIYMYGFSRGGMMTYLALKHGAKVRAAAVIGGPADLLSGLARRPEMEGEYRETMPEYDKRKLVFRNVTQVNGHDGALSE